MIYIGEVSAQKSNGEDVEIHVLNVRMKKDAQWREYRSSFDCTMSYSEAKAFPIGRKVSIEIKPK